MKVIFLQEVANVARKNEVKRVKDGYARNFLIPNKLAKIATLQDLERLEIIRKSDEEKNKKELKNKKLMVDKIEGKEFILKFKVGDEGQLFESVTATKIAQAIKEQGFEVDENQIILEKPIKSIGEFPISINFGDNLQSKIVVVITKLK